MRVTSVLAPLVTTAAVLVAGPADASPDLHLSLGGELAGGGGMTSGAFRSSLLVGLPLGAGRLRPDLAVGGTFGVGSLLAPDPRAVSGDVSLSHRDYGPIVEAGVSFTKDGEPTTRVFASLAALHVDLDDRLRVDPIPGVVAGGRAYRASVGANWVRAVVRAHDHEPGDGDLAFLMFMLPHQAEVILTEDSGTRRYGAALSWGL